MKKIIENNTAPVKDDHDEDHERNLCIAGKLSVVALKTVLAGAHNCLIPTISAAAKDETPKRPPPMKYKDLPIYDCPHLRYKEYENDKLSCADLNRKTVHEFFQPIVSDYRKEIGGTIKDLRQVMAETVDEVSGDFFKARTKLLNKMRCPENNNARMLLMTAGAVAGLRMGSTIPRKLFYTGLGLFVTGMICCPQATDETARTLMYMLGKAFVPIYNFYFGTDWALRERVPCTRDLPQIPPPTKPLEVCAPPKK